MRRESHLPSELTEFLATFPVRSVGDEHLEVDATASVRIVGDVYGTRVNSAASVILEPQCEGIASTMVTVEFVLVGHIASGCRHGLDEQAKHWLHEVVSNARTEFSSRSAEFEFDVLELGVPDRDPVELDGVPAFGTQGIPAIHSISTLALNNSPPPNAVRAGLDAGKYVV